jgi:hypothetical protein
MSRITKWHSAWPHILLFLVLQRAPCALAQSARSRHHWPPEAATIDQVSTKRAWRGVSSFEFFEFASEVAETRVFIDFFEFAALDFAVVFSSRRFDRGAT